MDALELIDLKEELSELQYMEMKLEQDKKQQQEAANSKRPRR